MKQKRIGIQRASLVFGVVFLSTGVIRADTDFQQWTAGIIQKDLTPGVRGYLELQPRFSENWSLLDRVIVRPALLFPISSGLTLGLGYAAIPILQPADSLEQRLWEQVVFDGAADWGTFTNRTRLEQRFVEGAGETAWRLRHQFKALVRLGEESPWAIAASDEVFFHLNSASESIQSGFDQNRAFLGLSWKASPEFRVEGGYLLDSVNKPAGTEDRVNHIFALTFFWNPGSG